MADQVFNSVIDNINVITTITGAPTNTSSLKPAYQLGDFCLSTDGSAYICTTAGRPGTWTEIGSKLSPPLDVPDGGTGQITLTPHGVLVGAGTSQVVITAAGTTGQLLVATTGADPSFQTLGAGGDLGGSYPNPTVVSVADVTTGTLLVANGGTGTGTLGAHGVLVGEGTGTVVATSTGAAGVPLIGQGAAADPAFGTATVPGGGTGAITLTAHGVLVGEGTGAVVATSSGATGVPLIGQGAAADPIFGTVTVPGGGTGAITLTAHGVLLGEGTGTVVATTAGATNTVLQGATGADPAFTATPTVTSLTTTGNLNLSQNPPSGAATVVTTGNTIVSANGVQRLSSAAAVTGLILTAGTVAGQIIELLNTNSNSASTMTFAASGTSNVSNGTSSVISANSGISLVWDSVETLWFPVGSSGGASGTTAFADQFLAQSGTTVTLTSTPGTILGVYVNGVAQRKTTDWSLAGSVITFVSTLVSDDVIVTYTGSTGALAGNISVVHQEFASASGTTVTLNQTNIGGVVLVARNGVIQRETTDYTVNATTGVITFTTTLVSEQITAAFITGGGGVGNATTLGGFAAVAAPTAAAIPVTDGTGRLNPFGQYSLIKRTVILNGTTSYTPTAGVRALLVQCLGAGGGGGGIAGLATNSSGSAGGGGGGYSESFITNLPASPITVAVGGGGPGGTAGANNGTSGGNTAFNTTTVTAIGGSGGGGCTATAVAGTITSAGGPGGVVGTGDIAIAGGPGDYALATGTNSATAGGKGGNGAGPLGGGGAVSSSNAAGINAANYGGGGSGASAQNLAVNRVGGNGANGVMVIWEFQ